MNKNILTNIKLTITADEITQCNGDYKGILLKMSNALYNFDFVYSYVVYSKYNKNELVNILSEFIITVNISQTERYNTISIENVLMSIYKTILDEVHKSSELYIVGYKQPPLDIVVETYQPLIHKLAISQQRRWSSLPLEYEDLVQECYIVLIELYNKGYYIHKTLLERSYNNHILALIRSYRNGKEILSLNSSVDSKDGLKLEDVIPDTSMEEKALNLVNDDAKMLEELSEFIIDKIGERSYNQLVFEYKTKNTTPWGRNKIYWLKDYIKQNGLNEYIKRRY